MKTAFISEFWFHLTFVVFFKGSASFMNFDSTELLLFFKGSASSDTRTSSKSLHKDKEESKSKKREAEKRSIDKACPIHSSSQ